MIYTVNNNISYNYSKFITRPKWGIALHRNKEFFVWKKQTQLSNKPYQSFFSKTQNFFIRQSKEFLLNYTPKPMPQYLKHNKRAGIEKNSKYLAKMTQRFLDVPNLFSNWIKLKNNLDKKLKVLKFFNQNQLKSNFINIHLNNKSQRTNNNLDFNTTVFYSKELLCWRSDLAFLNLRGFFSNTLKALHICWVAIRNNKRILFINNHLSIDSKAKAQYINNILTKQYQRDTIPWQLLGKWIYEETSKGLKNKKINQQKKGFMVDVSKQRTQNVSHLNGGQYKWPTLNFAQGDRRSKAIISKQKVKVEETLLNKLAISKSLPNKITFLSKKKNKNTSFLFTSLLKYNFNYSQSKRLRQKSSTLFFSQLLSFLNYSFWNKVKPKARPGRIINNRIYNYFIDSGLYKDDQLKTLYTNQEAWIGSKGYGHSVENSHIPESNSKQDEIIINYNLTKLQGKVCQAISRQFAIALTAQISGYLSNSKVGFKKIYNLLYWGFNNQLSLAQVRPLINYNQTLNQLRALNYIRYDKQDSLITEIAKAKYVKEKQRSYPAKAVFRPSFFYFTWRPKNSPILKNNSLLPKAAWTFWSVLKNSQRFKVKSVTTLSRNKKLMDKDSVLLSKNENSNQLDTFFPIKKTTDWIFVKKHILDSEVRKTYWHPLYKDKKNNNIFSLSINPKNMRQNHYNLLSFKTIPLKIYDADYIGPNFDSIFLFSKNYNLSEQLYPFTASYRWSKSFYHKKYLKINKREVQIRCDMKESLYKSPELWMQNNSSKIAKPPTMLKNLSKTSAVLLLLMHARKSNIMSVNALSAYNSYRVSYLWSNNFFDRTFKKTWGYFNENIWLICYKKRFYRTYLQQKQFIYKKKSSIKLKLKRRPKGKLSNHVCSFPYAQMSSKMGYHLYKYYKELLISNNLSYHSGFVKSPWLKQADLIFFIDPEKNQGLVNQAKRLRVLTLGIVSGLMSNRLGRHSFQKYSLEDSVDYPIVGNPTSCFFVQAVLDIFIKTLCKANDSIFFHFNEKTG